MPAAQESFKGIENFVLVSPEGVTLVPGTVRGLGACRTVVLYPSPSILGPQSPSPYCSRQAIVLHSHSKLSILGRTACWDF